jgi:hypothetical protein
MLTRPCLQALLRQYLYFCTSKASTSKATVELDADEAMPWIVSSAAEVMAANSSMTCLSSASYTPPVAR